MGFWDKFIKSFLDPLKKNVEIPQHFFRIRVRNFFTKLVFQWLWRTISFVACITVILDHKNTFRVLGISNWKTFLKFQKIVRSTECLDLKLEWFDSLPEYISKL